MLSNILELYRSQFLDTRFHQRIARLPHARAVLNPSHHVHTSETHIRQLIVLRFKHASDVERNPCLSLDALLANRQIGWHLWAADQTMASVFVAAQERLL